MSFSQSALERYSRQIVLDFIGYEGQLKLRGSNITIVGLGGLGSPIAYQLTAMGVGKIRLIDRDVLELSNLHRQILYDTTHLGYPKAEIAEKRLKALNPDVRFEPITISVNADTAGEIVKDSDVVLDGLDSIEARYALNKACIDLGIPYIYGSAIEMVGATSTILPKDTACLECFYPNIRDDDLPKCGTEGVHPSVLSTIAGIQTSEAVRLILGLKPNLANRLLFFNATDLSFDQIQVSRQEDCPACGTKPISTGRRGERRLIEYICGREGGKRVFVINPKENLSLPLQRLAEQLQKSGFEIRLKSDLGLSFLCDSKVGFNLLNSGVAVLVGVKEEDEALDLYKKFVVDGLKIPWEKIDGSASSSAEYSEFGQ